MREQTNLLSTSLHARFAAEQAVSVALAGAFSFAIFYDATISWLGHRAAEPRV